MSIPTTNVAISANKPFAIRWGAVTAGLLISIVTGMLLNLLGIGLGLVAAPSVGNAASAIGTAGIAWYVVSGAIAMYLGGWASGFFSHTYQRTESVLYGVVTWSLATLLGVVLTMCGAGATIGGAANMVTGSMSAVRKQTMKAITAPIAVVFPNQDEVFDTIKQQVSGLLDQAGKASQRLANNAEQNSQPAQPTSAKQALRAIMSNSTRLELSQAASKWLTADKEQVAQQARQKIVDTLVKETDLSRDEVEKAVEAWQSYYTNMKQIAQEKAEQAKQAAKEMAQQTSRVVGSVAIGVFFVLLLGALAAGYGSLLGARAQVKDLDVRVHTGTART